MLGRIYIDNYKCLVNFELRFQELTLLLGDDGAGKSSVLEVVLALRRLLNGEARLTDSGIFPANTLTRWQSRNLQVFEIDANLGEDSLIYRLEVEHETGGKESRIAVESLEADDRPLFAFKGGKVRLFRDDHSEGPVFGSDPSESALAKVVEAKDNVRLTKFLDFVRKILVCRLCPFNFEAETSSDGAALRPDGRNFSSWYRHAQLEWPERVTELTKELQEIMGDFRGLRLERVGSDIRALKVKFDEAGRDYELGLDEISDGQRALIALYALLRLGAEQGRALFLDEPANYVALSEIQPWLIELADSCGDAAAQVVLCSHHPELIDYLGDDCGLLLRRESSGVTRAEKILENTDGRGLKLSELLARGWDP